MNNVDFEHRYNEALDEMLHTAIDPGSIPTLPELLAAIGEGIEGEQHSFPDFEVFFAWWHSFTGYDQRDEDVSAVDHKPILKIAYAALRAEGRF